MVRAVAFGITAILFAMLAYALLTGSLLVVLTGSMVPAIMPGDVVFVQPRQGTVAPGQVITYERNGKLITHRVVVVDGEALRTKGDNSAQEDPAPVPMDQVRGVVRARIPYLGWLIAFIRRPLGWLVVVVVPAVLLFVLEARDFARALRRHRAAREAQG